jgi:predicted O-methyltransferase YrrM
MEIINPEIEKYLLLLLKTENEVLEEMEQFGDRNKFPIIGPLLGNVLMQTARSIRARKILEMGSGYGYSAFWFAMGMEKEGTVIACDKSDENARQARKYFERAGMSNLLDFRTEDAFKVIDLISDELDIVFIDCNKDQYPEALGKALPKVRSGGMIIAHNVLWYGTVVEGDRGGVTSYIKEFNRLLYDTPELITTIVPVWDGLSISLKK